MVETQNEELEISGFYAAKLNQFNSIVTSE